MQRGTTRRCAVVVAALLALAEFGAPAVHADDTVPTTPPPTSVPLAPAGRGTAVQVEPTDPPPTTTLPPVTSPPRLSGDSVPWFSGTGRRVVYSKGSMRVWIVDGSENLVRSHLVSGRLNQPNYGEYRVFSRSAFTCNIDHPETCMRWMVRFTTGPNGDNIGFHEIPRKNGWPVQTDSQLGQALSSGCVRQSTDDAWFMWNWAGVGTKVVVIP
jgi:hypothetical protein